MTAKTFEACRQLDRNIPKKAGERYGAYSVRHRIIEYPAYCEIRRKIAQVHLRGKHANVASGLLITGQSGAGKTTVLTQYCAQYPRREEAERTIVPVLVVNTPATPTVKNLAESILDALGDPLVNKGSTEEKTRRIYRYLIECKVELLIIDEFQHFHDSHRRHEARQVTDWLKNVLNVAQIPVVVVGLPRASLVIRSNEQLARRFSSETYLRPFGIGTETEQSEFRAVLKEIQSDLPIPTISLYQPELAGRFFVASNGLIDYVAKIVDAAISIADERRYPELTMEVLELAFSESVWSLAPPALNPFNPASELRPLDCAGEPFELWDDPAKYVSGAVCGK